MGEQLKRATSETEALGKKADNLSSELAIAKNKCSVLTKQLEEGNLDKEALSST